MRYRLLIARHLVWLVALSSSMAIAQDWPQWRGPQRDGIWPEDGIRSDLPDGQLPIAWSTEIGSGYSGPTVAGGRVYVMDRMVSDRKETERVLCLDSGSGKIVWKHEYDAPYSISYKAGPRASVTVVDNQAFSVGAMGHFYCFDAKSGDVIWQRDLLSDFDIEMPIWGIAASPLVYKNLVIQQVGGRDGACMVAMDKSTGKEVWRSLKERAGYSSPIIIKQADQDVLVCWTADSLSGLDPNSGKVHWAHPFPPSRMPIGIGAPIWDGEYLFVSSFYDGSLMVNTHKDKLASDLVWRKVGPDEQHTESLHSMIGTCLLQGDYVYGVDSYGEMRCLERTTGKRVWEDLTAVPKARWATIHTVKQGDRYWLFNERGELLIAQFSPTGLTILDRCNLIEPTREQLGQRNGVCWSHPAYAEKSVFARNDLQIVRASLSQ
jgi:outer membrane protein assembly factor BamB